MTNLLTAIQQYLTENPIADESQRNWESVAAAMRAITETTSNIHVSGKATIVGLDMQGIDSDSIRTVLESSPSGRGVLGLLDSGQLVDWVDPVTVAALAKNTGDGMLSTEDVEALKSLSVSITNPFESETAESCQLAYVSHTLNGEWSTLQNAGINEALATGDRAGLAALLHAAAVQIGGE